MLAVLLVVSVLAALNARWGPESDSGDYVLRVTFRHYGVDAGELERTIAIPLEDALGKIPGCNTIVTTVDYALVRVSVRFDPEGEEDSLYALASEAVYRLYSTLPESVQRPEIDSAREDDSPVWMAAVNLRQNTDTGILEKKIKPGFARIEGAGSVEVYGLEVTETVVSADREKLAASPLQIEALSAFLARDDVIKSAGYVVSGSKKIPVVIDGRYESLSEIDNALYYFTESLLVRLNTVAHTRLQKRKPDSISRVNGVRCPVIAVKEGNGASLFALSAALAKEAEFWRGQGVEITILSDRGAALQSAFMKLLGSVAQSIVVLALAGFLLTILRKQHTQRPCNPLGYISLTFVPAVLIVSLGIIAAFGISIDSFTLAGLAVGMGAAIDTCLLLVEELGCAHTEADGIMLIRALAPSLAGGTATTVIALAPLVMFRYFGSEIVHLASGIAVSNATALALGLVILPPLIRSLLFGVSRRGYRQPKTTSCDAGSSKSAERIKSVSIKVIKKSHVIKVLRRALFVFVCSEKTRNGRISLFVWLILTGAGIGALFLLVPDPMLPDRDTSVVYHVEMESGASMENADTILKKLSENVRALAGVQSVQTSAYRGYGIMAVVFDDKHIDKDALAASIAGIDVTGAFLWTDENLEGRRMWKIHLLGDETALCEQYAQELAKACSGLSFVRDVVLNFKTGAPDIVLVPLRENLVKRGLDFFALGRALRFSIYGPVMYKRISGGKEYDTRFFVRSDDEFDRADILDTILADGKSMAGDLVVMHDVAGTSRIYRRDKRREATITISTGIMDPFDVKRKIEPYIKALGLPPRYEAQFDKDTLRQAERLRMSIVPFALAALGIVLALAVLAESFLDAFLVLLTVPPSLALPCILLLVSGATIKPALVCSFIAVSGIVVNASVLLFDTAKAFLRRYPTMPQYHLFLKTIKRRGASLAATCATTLAGSVPILLMSGAQNEVVRSLAFVTFWGVLASGILSVLFMPLMLRIRQIYRKDGCRCYPESRKEDV